MGWEGANNFGADLICNAIHLSTNGAYMAMQTTDAGKIVVTIFYPNATTGANLVQAFHQSLKNLGEAEALDARPWRLDVLEWPEMRSQAVHDVANSAIIVVPADNAYAGSTFFRHWVESWPIGLDGCSLLLVSTGNQLETESTPEIPQFTRWLRDIAVRKGMEFTDTQVETGLIAPGTRRDEGRAAAAARGFSQANDHSKIAGDLLTDWQLPPAPRFRGLNE